MALPQVSGWLIDFRTADSIFSSGSNVRIDHCLELCGAGGLFFCHEEEKLFKATPKLKQAFMDNCDCLLFPDHDVMQRCVSVQNNPICKKLFNGNRLAIILLLPQHAAILV